MSNSSAEIFEFTQYSKSYAPTKVNEVSIPESEKSEFLGTDVTSSEPRSARLPFFASHVGDLYAAAFAQPIAEMLVQRNAEAKVDHRSFYSALNAWKKEVAFVSSISEQVASPSYLRIIGMGEKVLPLILRELKEEPAMFFPALEAITGLNDVIPEECYGDLEAMSEAWLSWGRAKKLI
jgi:hypothetical protein